MANNAVATREQNNAPAQREASPVAVIRAELGKLESEFQMALPSHIKPDKFQRTIMTAVQQDPKLIQADRRSLWSSCMKAAQDGLLPDGREAALVIFRTKIDGQWRDAVQYMPMVYGLRKKILQSGEVVDLQVGVVYRAELESGAFRYEIGTVPPLQHKPSMTLTPEESADDEIVAAYSIATMKDGTKSYEVMRRFEIDKVRECSQTGATRDRNGQPRNPSGPWVDWFPEQSKKTVMRRHSKVLPMSGDIIDVEAADDAAYVRSAVQLLAHGQGPAPTGPRSRLDALEQRITPHDEVTGEVLDDTSNRDQSSDAGDPPTPPAGGSTEPPATAARTPEGAATADSNAGSDTDWPAWLEQVGEEIERVENVIDLNSYWASIAEERDAAPKAYADKAQTLYDAKLAGLKKGTRR